MDERGVRRQRARDEVTDLSGRRIEAVIFDLGDTLLHFGTLSKGQLIEEAMRRSYAYLQEHNQPAGPFRTYRLLHLWGMRWYLLRSWVTGKDFNSLELLATYSMKNGMTLTPEQLEELNWRWYEKLAEAGVVEPGTAEALGSLKAMGLDLGVLSNTFIHKSSLERHLEQEGLLHFFPVRLYSYEFPWRKPHVKIFQEAAKRVGVAPEKILFVGDLIHKDVAGALAAGMEAALKVGPSNAGRTVPRGVHCIDKIADLPALIKAIESQSEKKPGERHERTE